MCNGNHGRIAPFGIGNYGNYGGEQRYIRRSYNPETGDRFLTFGQRSANHDKHITFDENMRPVDISETFG